MIVVEFIDESYIDNSAHRIQIVAPGILVSNNTVLPGYKKFYPWHRINSMSGIPGEFEHELAQFEFLGVSNA